MTFTYDLLKDIETAVHRLAQREPDGSLNLSAKDADMAEKILNACSRLASQAYLIPIGLDLLRKNAFARQEFLRTGNPRAAARVMGWSKGKRGPSREVGVGVVADPPEHSDELLFYEYLDLIVTEEKTKAVHCLKKKYSLQSYEAAYQRLKRGRASVLENLKEGGADTKHLEGILPPDWPK